MLWAPELIGIGGRRTVPPLLIRLRDRGVARGTFKADHYGIRSLYHQTLGRDWALFSKKDSAADAEAPAQCPGR